MMSHPMLHPPRLASTFAGTPNRAIACSLAIHIFAIFSYKDHMSPAEDNGGREFPDHRSQSDEAYQVCKGLTPIGAYLTIDDITRVVLEHGVNMIHPCENAEFASKVEQAGLAFVGPSPEVIDSLGDKTKARTLGTASLTSGPYARELMPRPACSDEGRSRTSPPDASTHLDDLADLDSTLESLISSLSRLSTRQLATRFTDVVQDVRAEYITIFLKRMQPHVHVELSSSAHAWSILHEEHLAVIETMITSIATLSDTAATEKYLVQPMIVLHVLNAAPASSNEVLESLVSALRDLTTNGVPAHNPIRELLDNKVEDVQPFELPSFLVPPDVLDMDSLSDGVEAVVGDKKDDLPAYPIRLFDNTMSTRSL
ncbi:hypothetical protein EXIGLDRAFT_794276 [Exidia glandulosa HHB12029]|uniref:Biotin carboxylation domain-containing protein n=1 Tax=Exidia glandulosa HHB12029 TaxID=1314781 RepID=A0A165GGI7_EXIGL|nr:hypothetical protein EXIGLDRAFT_794276 [Exidia glandulosa HHB12029]